MDHRARTLSLDSQFEAVRSAERRRLLLALAETNLMDVADLEANDRENSILLRHVHLPKLAEFDLIALSDDGRRVSRGAAFDDIELVLEFLQDDRNVLSACSD